MGYNYVLIHGGWHGSWMWRDIVPKLRDAGHTVYTPDLPGHYKTTSRYKNVTLPIYVQYIEQLVHTIGTEVIMVGHCIGGIVMSQVAENLPDKVKKLIYISGFVLKDGSSIMEYVDGLQNLETASNIEIVIEGRYFHIKSQQLREILYGECSNADFEYALAHLQPEPLQPYTDKVQLTNDRFGRVPKTYIECTKDKAVPIEYQRRMHATIDCRVVTLVSDHSPFFSSQEGLVNGLLLA